MVQKHDPTGLDAYSPAEVAIRIEAAGVRKAVLPAVPLATLSVLAGVFIALGAAAFTAAMAGAGLSAVFPITGFVLLGYEHSIANMYLIPAGWVAGSPVNITGFLANLIPVTIGNVIGGAGGVALTYRLAYRPNGG